MDPNSNQQFKQPSLPAPAAIPEPQAAGPTQPLQQPGYGGPDNPAMSSHLAGGIPQVAEDTDIIEPVWASRVEAVLGGNIQDPRELVRQLGAVKADYIAQRYGMTLKQGADQR